MLRIRLRTYVPALVSISILAALVYFLGIDNVINAFFHANKGIITITLLLSLFIVFLRSFRLKRLIDSGGIESDVKNVVGITFIGVFLGAITPSRIGETGRAFFIRNLFGIPLGESVSIVFIDKVMDLLMIFSFAIYGLIFCTAFTLGSFTREYAISLFFSGAFLIFTFWLLTDQNFGKRILLSISSRFFLLFRRKYIVDKAMGFIELFYSGFTKIKTKKTIVTIFAISLGIWILNMVQAYMIFLAFNINQPFKVVVAFFSTAVLVGIIPITLSGIGTRDAAIVFLFSIVNVSPQDALGASIMITLVSSLFVASIGAALLNKSTYKIEYRGKINDNGH